MIELDARTSISVREARKFREHLYREAAIAQVFTAVVLVVMAYFGFAVRWMIVVGFFLGIGTVCTLIIDCASRLDAGRSYLEQCSDDTEKHVISIIDKLKVS